MRPSRLTSRLQRMTTLAEARSLLQARQREAQETEQVRGSNR